MQANSPPSTVSAEDAVVFELDGASLRQQMQIQQLSAKPARGFSTLLRLYFELSKLRLSALVSISAAAGFMAASQDMTHWPRFALAVAGTLFSAMGANAFNQIIERDRDALMERTRLRPLPSGRLTVQQARVWALLSCSAGIAILLFAGPLPAALSLLTILIYTLVYTPSKIVTPYNTLLGSVVGAIPPLIGWSANTGSLGFGAFCLALILFTWQMPHFLSLAWMYRDDYARGGYKMLGVIEPSGKLTGRMILCYSLALMPCSLLLVWIGASGWTFGVVSIILGLWICNLALRFMLDPSEAQSRRVFFGSLIYLTILLGVLMFSPGRSQPQFQAWTSGVAGNTVR